MKILYIIDTLTSGGKERQLVEIIKKLPANYIVGVLTFDGQQHYTEQVRQLCPFYCELKKRPTRLEPFFTIWKIFRDFKPDLVHTWDPLSSLYCFLPCRWHRIPYIEGSVRDAGIEKGWEYHYKRFFLKMANGVIANSQAGLDYYRVKGNIVYNLIDINRFTLAENTKENNLVNVSNFTDYKDHTTFFKAVIPLVKNGLLDRVFVIGTGKYEAYWRQKIAEEGVTVASKIIFTGRTHDIEQYLAQCKIGVLCSTRKYSEGISNSVLEYMASGLIAVAARTGAIPEMIDDGRNGFMYETANANDLKGKIERILSGTVNHEEIKKEAFNTLNEKFGVENNLKKLLGIYETTTCNTK